MKIVIVLACLLAIIAPFEASSESGRKEQWPAQMPFSNFAPIDYGVKLFEELKNAVKVSYHPVNKTCSVDWSC